MTILNILIAVIVNSAAVVLVLSSLHTHTQNLLSKQSIKMLTPSHPSSSHSR